MLYSGSYFSLFPVLAIYLNYIYSFRCFILLAILVVIIASKRSSNQCKKLSESS